MIKYLMQHIPLSAGNKPMNRELKNIKIAPDTHQRLRVHAARTGIAIGECADLLLIEALNTLEHPEPVPVKKVHRNPAKAPKP